MTVSIPIPVRFDHVDPKSGRSVRGTNVHQTDIRILEDAKIVGDTDCDGPTFWKDEDHLKREIEAEGLVWRSVFLRAEDGEIAFPSIEDAAQILTSTQFEMDQDFGEFSPFREWERFGSNHDKRQDERPLRSIAASDVSDMPGYEKALRRALKDASRLAFFDGELLTSRHQPTLVRWSPGRWAIRLKPVDPRPEATLSRYRTGDTIRLALPNFEQKLDILGLDDQATIERVLAESPYDFSTLDTRESFPDWAVEAFQILKNRLNAIVPSSRSECLVGRGYLSHVDMPAELDELAFEGRRLMRRCLDSVEDTGWHDLPVDDLFAWFETSEECVERHTRLHLNQSDTLGAFDKDERQVIQRWWHSIERPRLLGAGQMLPEDDMDAISGFAP